MSQPLLLLTTERLAVSLVEAADAPALLAFHRANRDRLRPWLPPAPPRFLTLEYWEQWAALARDLFVDDRAVRLVLRDRTLAEAAAAGRAEAPDAILGQINFSHIIRGPLQACYVGYHLDAAAEGRGVMTEAMRAAIDLMFGPMELHRIMANHLPENARSARLLARLGFREEGLAKEYLFIDGAWRDHILTALTNPSAPPPLAVH